MKKIVTILSVILVLSSCKSDKKEIKKNMNEKPKTTAVKGKIYDYKVLDLKGDEYDLAQLKGKKVMIVNTASKCGFTPQYKQLQEMYDTYKDDNFVIVGFPANNFMSQEPGTNQEIAAFCKENYGVTFPMMSKISVKGKDMNEFYKFLTDKSLNGVEDSQVSWNFQKYLINESGEIERVINPKTLPNDPSIISWIKE